MRSKVAGNVVLAVWAVLVAWGGAAQAQPPAAPRQRMFDETELYVRLWTQNPESGGYVFRLNGVVYNVGSQQDAIRVDLKQRGRVFSTVRCPFVEMDGDAGRIECESPGGLTATGDVAVDLVYVDDQTESTEVIRSMNLRVNAYPYWVRTDGRRQIMGTQYQIDGSDLLGSVFAYMEHPSLVQTATDQPQQMSFYAGFSGFFDGGEVNPVLRCTAGGQRIPDREVSWSARQEYDTSEWTSPTGEIRRIGWYRARISVQSLWWGTRLPMPESGSGYDPTNLVFLGEHPGEWSCDLRQAGRVYRTFRFTVDARGRVVTHAEHQGPSGMRVIPGLTLIDVRFPSPPPIDQAFDPAAIRRGSQYGRPWSAADAVRDMLAGLPAANGSSAPSGGGGGGRRGR